VSQIFARSIHVQADLNIIGGDLLGGSPAVIHCDPVDDDLGTIHIPFRTLDGKIYAGVVSFFLAVMTRRVLLWRSSDLWLQMAGLMPVSLYFFLHLHVACRPSEWWWGVHDPLPGLGEQSRGARGSQRNRFFILAGAPILCRQL